MLQSELTLFQPDIANAWHVSTQSLTGLPQAVPLLIILVVAVASGRARPARGETNARLPLPGSGRVARVPLALAIVVGAVLVFSAPSYSDALMTTFGIGIIIASVVVVSGYAGQLSLCQYALAGFGAWAAARSASSLDVPFLVALVDRCRGRNRGGRARRPPGDPDPRGDARDRHVGALARVQRADIRQSRA